MKHKVAELEDRTLDRAVALALGWQFHEGDSPDEFGYCLSGMKQWAKRPGGTQWECAGCWDLPPAFSTEWQHGGPVIDSERMSVWDEKITYAGDKSAGWYAAYEIGSSHDFDILGRHQQRGATALVAAMRSFVASKFGDEAELP